MNTLGSKVDVSIRGTDIIADECGSNASNMLFIDHPAQVGFSYSVPVPAYESESGDIVSLPNATCPDYAEGLGTCGTYSYPNQTDTANSTVNAAPVSDLPHWCACQSKD